MRTRHFLHFLAGEIVLRLGRFSRHFTVWQRDLASKFPFGFGFKVSITSESIVIQDPHGAILHIAAEKRLQLYSRGIDKRISNLAGQYLLDRVSLQPGDFFVDIGANVGELGVWSHSKGLRYLGIDPDPAVLHALKKNVGESNAAGIALGKEPGIARLFVKTDTADTSLFPISDGSGVQVLEVDVEKLDNVLANRGITTEVGILKVEAEGFEPEVLLGATNTLSRTKWCTVDAGPERNGESTLPDVVAILRKNGFTLVDAHRGRNTYLFKNVSLVSD